MNHELEKVTHTTVTNTGAVACLDCTQRLHYV